MTLQEINSLKDYLNKHGEKVDTIIYGARIPLSEPITKVGGEGIDYGLIMSNTFIFPKAWSFWRRLKWAFFPPKLTSLNRSDKNYLFKQK